MKRLAYFITRLGRGRGEHLPHLRGHEPAQREVVREHEGGVGAGVHDREAGVGDTRRVQGDCEEEGLRVRGVSGEVLLNCDEDGARGLGDDGGG